MEEKSVYNDYSSGTLKLCRESEWFTYRGSS